MITLKVMCQYCDKPAQLVTGKAIYPHRPDLYGKRFWQCAKCKSYVGCHPPARANGKGGRGDGTLPLGRLANAELRQAKQEAHEAFDPLWKDGEMTRREAYAWLADQLGLQGGSCHIGEFDVARCKAVVDIVSKRYST